MLARGVCELHAERIGEALVNRRNSEKPRTLRIHQDDQGSHNMSSDIEIAQAGKMVRIATLAQERLGIADEHLVPYGHYKAKVSLDYLETIKDRPDGKLILVTAISPTPAGEGKTTTTLGLGDAMLKQLQSGPCAAAFLQYENVLEVKRRQGEECRVCLKDEGVSDSLSFNFSQEDLESRLVAERVA